MPMIATTMSSSISVKPRLLPSVTRMERNALMCCLPCCEFETSAVTTTGLDGRRRPRAVSPGGHLVTRNRRDDRHACRVPRQHEQRAARIVHRIRVDDGLLDETTEVGDVDPGRVVEGDVPVRVGAGDRDGAAA